MLVILYSFGSKWLANFELPLQDVNQIILLRLNPLKIFNNNNFNKMPTNSNFSFSVQIGNHDVPEYEKDGELYVESNLFTPFSYEQEVRELVCGEVEVQKWPVTPYTVKVTLHPGQDASAMHLSIDGVRICNCVLKEGGTQ